MLELDQETLEELGVMHLGSALFSCSCVGREKQPGNKATLKSHNHKWYQNKAKVKTSVVVLLIITAGENEIMQPLK